MKPKRKIEIHPPDYHCCDCDEYEHLNFYPKKSPLEWELHTCPNCGKAKKRKLLDLLFDQYIESLEQK